MSHNNTPRETGTAWERRVADYAAAKGLPWDRAPLRGTADLLDIQGSLVMGWLVGCKAKRKGSGDRLSEAMTEARKAWVRAGSEPWVIPVQIIQRPGYPVGKSFTVMETDDFLQIVMMRRAQEE